MELNFKNIKRAAGEITYLFAAVALSLFIITYICIIVMTTSYFNIEYYIREIANRLSAKSLTSIKDLSNKNNLEKEFENELAILEKNIISKSNNNILKDFFKIKNFLIEEVENREYENFKLFKISYLSSENYKMEGIIEYKPRSSAYIFIFLNEEIKGEK